MTFYTVNSVLCETMLKSFERIKQPRKNCEFLWRTSTYGGSCGYLQKSFLFPYTYLTDRQFWLTTVLACPKHSEKSRQPVTFAIGPNLNKQVALYSHFRLPAVLRPIILSQSTQSPYLKTQDTLCPKYLPLALTIFLSPAEGCLSWSTLFQTAICLNVFLLAEPAAKLWSNLLPLATIWPII